MAKVIVKNKIAHFNYELFDKFEAGIVLSGWEVKSIRANNVILKNAFITSKKGEFFLTNMHIKKYMNLNCDETQSRKLLLHKSQIKKLHEKIKMKRMTIVPTALKWTNKNIIKVDIALGRGKSKIDKREVIKKREIDRNLQKYY